MNKVTYRKREMIYAAFVLPALLIFIIFFFYPVCSTLVLAFTDKKTMSPEMHFIAFQNFRELFTETPVFYTAIKNNIFFTIVVTVLQSLFAFILALALDKALQGKNFFKTFFFAPVVISSVAISLIWSFMYDPNTGVLNSLFSVLHLDFLAQNWLGDKNIAMFSICLVQIWQWVGFEMIIFMAGLNNIPKESYEVAQVEGAKYFQTLFKVVIPQMRATILMAAVLTTVGCFKVFDLVYIMTGGGPVQTTEVIAKMIYDYAFKYDRMGFASAMSVVLLVIIMAVGFGQMYLLRDKEEQR